jgi:hypothetical protein
MENQWKLFPPPNTKKVIEVPFGFMKHILFVAYIPMEMRCKFEFASN